MYLGLWRGRGSEFEILVYLFIQEVPGWKDETNLRVFTYQKPNCLLLFD